MLVVSTVSSASVLVYFLINRSHLRHFASRLLFYLAASDFVGVFFWMVGVTIPQNCPGLIVLSDIGRKCASIWSVVIGFHLVITSSSKFLPREIYYHVIAWGIPILIDIFLLSYHMYFYTPIEGCWISFGLPFILSYVLPKMICFGLNLLFLFIVIVKIKSSSKTWGDVNLKRKQKTLLFILICYFIYSIDTIISVFTVVQGAVFFTAVILAASQGFLNAAIILRKPLLDYLSHKHGSNTTTERSVDTAAANTSSSDDNAGSLETSTV